MEKSIESKLNMSLKNKTMLRGEIINITKEQIQVCISGERRIRITIPMEESTLYIPLKIREMEEGQNTFLEAYLGATIPFVVTSDEEGNVTGSMIEARKIGIAEIKEMQLPKEISVNILLVTKDYMAVEYHGLIQTIGSYDVAITEIKSLKDYIKNNRSNEIEKFILTKLENEHVGVMKLDKYGILDKRFIDKIENKEYQEGDFCKGEVTSINVSGRMMIEIEPGILGVAHIPEGEKIVAGIKVQGIISGIDKAKHKLFMRRIKVLN